MWVRARSFARTQSLSRSWNAVTQVTPRTPIRPRTWPCSPAASARHELQPPGVGHTLARFQDDQVRPGDEAVGRAGHGLDRERPPAMGLSQAVARADLKPSVTVAHPQRKIAVRCAHAGPRLATGV